jgi:hypothetical protein
VQNRHDADVAIRKQLPIDQMPLVAADMAIHPELRRNRTPRKATFRYGGETFEQITDITLGLGLAPGGACVAVALIQPVSGAVLDSDSTHASGRSWPRLITVSASSGL